MSETFYIKKTAFDDNNLVSRAIVTLNYTALVQLNGAKA